MNLDHVQAELRPRLPWEAADFGLALGRRYAGALLRAWMSTAWLAWAAAIALLFVAPFWAFLPLWLLKPMMSVRPAFFLSRQLFGIAPSSKAARQALFAWLKRRAWADLTFARFHRRRGIMQIVRILEGNHASAQRLKLFHQTTPSWIIKGCLLLETSLYVGLVLMVFWFGPASWLPWSEESGGIGAFFENLTNYELSPVEEFRFGVINTVAYAIASMVSELAYITSCFGCYLNTRTELEGWDLEIAFKRLAARSAKLFTPPVLALMLMAGVCMMSSAKAEQAVSAAETPEQIADRIIADPDFTIHKEIERKWREDEPEFGSSSNVSWFGALVYPLAVIVIIAAVAGLLYLLIRYGSAQAQGISLPIMPQAVAGLDVRPESLPADPLGTARLWWSEGRHREALSLLYRAALSWLIHQGGVEIEAGDTEGECTRRVARTASTASVSFYFQQLTRAWLGLAYAQSPPSATTWDNLCSAWPFQNPVKPNHSSAAGTAMLLFACALLSGCDGRFEDSEETTGYKGEARFNPYLAVTRLNDEFDIPTRTSFSLLKELTQHDGDKSSQWVVTPSLLVNEYAAQKLLDRVADGDHLVMALSELFYYEEMGAKPPEWVNDKKSIAEDENTRRKRWREKQLADRDEEDEPFADFKKKEPKFDPTGVRLRKHLEKFKPGAAMIMKEAGVRFADEVDEDRVDEESLGSLDWDWPAAFIFSNGRKETPAQRVLTIEYGDGQITFLPSLRPFTNLRLANDRNASLWHSLVDEHGGEVFFIRGSGTSFLAILWEYGWRVIIAVLVALVLWLWAVTKRFGRLPPRRVPPPLDAKAGLVATGSFLLRKKQVPALLAPWSESLYARWQRNQPADPEPTQARFLAQVAADAGISEQEAAECFSPSERTRSRKFLSLAKRLWQLGRTF